MALLERIANNDPVLKEISLGDAADKYFSDVSEMVAALELNTVIDYVRVDRDFLPSLLGQPEKKAAVVSAIGRLPALRELRIMSGPVHANVLGKALTDAHNLENLELGAINLKGDQEDIKHLEDALRGHDKLSSFAMSNFTVDQDNVSMDELVKALGSIPTLQKVVLESHKEAKSHFTGEALAALCGDNQFKELRIANFRLYPQHYDLIQDAVAKTTTLEILRLNRVGMAQPCSIKLAAGLEKNRSLKMVDLSSNNIEDIGVAALADSLKNNATLEHLRLWDNKLIGEDGFNALADMLEVNDHIEKLDAPNTADHSGAARLKEILAKKRQDKYSD